MMKLIVFTSALTAGSLFMTASYAADEVQTQDQQQAVERAMDQTRTMQNNPGTAPQNMNQYGYQKGPGNGQGYGQGQGGGRYQNGGQGYGQGGGMNQNGRGYGQGGGMNRQGGGMGR